MKSATLGAFQRYQPIFLVFFMMSLLFFLVSQKVHAADQLLERLIKFKVVGTIESVDLLNGNAFVRFAGPMYATKVDPNTGIVSEELGPQLGNFDGARVKFHINPFKPVNDGDFATFSCEECQITFSDGSVLRPLLPDFGSINIPMAGRALMGIGLVPGDQPGEIIFRGIGCGGTQEVAGRGALANSKGAICMNGAFTFTITPQSIADFLTMQDNGDLVKGESDCTITMHVPVN